MSRIATRFAELQGEDRCALIPFVTAGDPAPGVTVDVMHALVGAGADVLELGVPFSDPMADGPVIQRASERALASGMSLDAVLDLVSEFRRGDVDTPVVLMGYLNPVEVYGYERFAGAASEAGVDGVITVDLPPEEGADLHHALAEQGLDTIYLIAPTTTDLRIARICESAGGFVYYVSLKGVTGASHLDADSVADNVQRIKRATSLPVGVGFGIRDALSAARMAGIADAVVVGTVLVQRVEELADRPRDIPRALAELLGAMRAAMDAHA